jgi:Ser/Thr protein kinase RdoA (MazF antagonist)
MGPDDAAAVADRFGLGRPIAEPAFAARGELGRIWRMATDAGTFAVKELFLDDPGDGRDDADFQLAAAAAGVPLPLPVRTPSGEVICRVGARHVRVYHWVDLDPTAPVDERTAGALLGRIHALRYPPTPVDPWYVAGVGVARWDEVVAGLPERTPWAERLAGLVPDLLAAEREVVLPAMGEPADADLIRGHLDFNPENVAVDADGRAVVLDWENSGGVVAQREVAMALWDFVTWGADGERRRADRVADFVDGYRSTGGTFDVGRGLEVFATAFAVQAHLLEFYARRAVDEAAGDENRRRSEHWLEEMTAKPLTLASASEALAAIR